MYIFQYLKYVLIGVSISALMACAPGSNWPKLSDPVPRPTPAPEAETSQPAESMTGLPPAAPAPETKFGDDDEALISHTLSGLHRGKQRYETALYALLTAESDEEQRLAWNSAQLALTRVSSNNDALNELVLTGDRRVVTISESTKAFLTTERARLDQLKPE